MKHNGDGTIGEIGLGHAPLSPSLGASDHMAEPGGESDPKPDTPPPGPGAPPRNPPRNPWQSPPSSGPRRAPGLEDLFKSRPGGNGPGSGGGGKTPPPPFRLSPDLLRGKFVALALAGAAAVWLAFTTGHQLSSNQEGIVTTFGKYSGTIGSGLTLTAPWPIQSVRVEDVTSIRRDSLPEGEAEMLMLTGDQSLVDLSYIVRWNIRNLKQYTYQLQDPKGTVIEVAEAAMRASVAEVKLGDVMGGVGRAEIEAHARQRMQSILDAYHAGILIQGVDIKKADPPAKVNGAFQKVQAAQQDANRDMSNAQAYAQQVVAKAEGDANAFNQVYAQYKLAPEVTRRRLYYTTMEQVLSSNDKVIAPQGTTSYLPLPAIQKKSADAPQGGAK